MHKTASARVIQSLQSASHYLAEATRWAEDKDEAPRKLYAWLKKATAEVQKAAEGAHAVTDDEAAK